ncbi:hypothetical protein ACSZM0_03545 [Aeromonas hydrophila]
MVINELLAPAQPITWLPWAVQYFFLIGLACGASGSARLSCGARRRIRGCRPWRRC